MWQFVFWASISVILYSYVGYPVILFVLSKLRAGRKIDVGVAELPSACLIISAFNEEQVLRAKIENSLQLDYPAGKLSILVASDGSTDATVPIAREFAGRGIAVYEGQERRGKSAVLNEVVKGRQEEIIVFTDANSVFSSDALARLNRNFVSDDVGCAVGRLCYVDQGASSVGKSESAYWRYESLVSRLESKLRSVLVANGSIFAVRRELIQTLNPDVANDFQIPADVASAGRGIVYEPEAIALEHTACYWHEEFDRKARIILRGLTGFARLRDRISGRRLWQFWSHKLLRWMVGIFLVMVFLANIALAAGSLFYSMTLATQILFYLLALHGWRQRGVAQAKLYYIPFYFMMVNAASVVAMMRYFRGQRQSVWEKAESTRNGEVHDVQFEEAVPLHLPETLVASVKSATEDEPVRVKAIKN